jgi:hypothetical protein
MAFPPRPYRASTAQTSRRREAPTTQSLGRAGQQKVEPSRRRCGPRRRRGTSHPHLRCKRCVRHDILESCWRYVRRYVVRGSDCSAGRGGGRCDLGRSTKAGSGQADKPQDHSAAVGRWRIHRRVHHTPYRAAADADLVGVRLASQVMSPRKHPPERAQNGTLTPAISRAATAHSTHALDETPHDGEEQIQAQDPPNHPPHHVTSSLSGVPALLSMDPTGTHWCLKVCCNVNCTIYQRWARDDLTTRGGPPTR